MTHQIRTLGLPACSTVSQSTALPRALIEAVGFSNFNWLCATLYTEEMDSLRELPTQEVETCQTNRDQLWPLTGLLMGHCHLE
jgi:hypothetical protein